MQLVTANNFFWARQFIKELISDLSDISVASLNRLLRRRFVGKELESISCCKVSSVVISTKITLGSAVTVFQTIIGRKEG